MKCESYRVPMIMQYYGDSDLMKVTAARQLNSSTDSGKLSVSWLIISVCGVDFISILLIKAYFEKYIFNKKLFLRFFPSCSLHNNLVLCDTNKLIHTIK